MIAMSELEFDLYRLFMEKLVDDLENDLMLLQLKYDYLEIMRSEKKETSDRVRSPWTTKPYPYTEPYTLQERCPTCQLKLDGVMSYTCNNPKCPVGMGPIMCGVLNGKQS